MDANREKEVEPAVLRCPRCASKDVAPSLRRGLIDQGMYRLGFLRRDCRYCGMRFYVRKKKWQADFPPA